MRQLPAIFLTLLAGLAGAPALADMAPREGWQVIETEMTHAVLLDRLLAAVPGEGMAVVTQAGPTAAAQARGIEIPENRVVGVFNNDFAVRILALSTAAMIEAPIRFYVTEDADGTATLSWKEPGFVLAPYMDEGGAELAEIAAELDRRFAAIAAAAMAQ
ncbi:DUF302 domain-containing protein [Roseicyclus mahoneyensis]|jgi:uncharacterized protein (DUF302 family)|uniref:Uncharacterized protein (DUF302 family) n=1 Tax=Roseicyclus mahoneyensis TaxID=164332 RepID=A0A316GMJ9_9RHOB|nr:DUF302 domain-containing protein [Roseicyclus mahoneyensis]PWK60642.1 uncharacterized protein (DUF302 family) [Roseicyclus mahoneyensis]